MKKLIIVRHGDYDHKTMRLNINGRNQMTELAKKIEKHINGCSLCILSSTAPRADDSAIVLSEYFNISYEPHVILWSDNDHVEDYVGVLKLLRQKKDDIDVIIMITHLEYTEYFTYYYMREELQVSVNCSFSLDKGSGVLINNETLNFVIL